MSLDYSGIEEKRFQSPGNDSFTARSELKAFKALLTSSPSAVDVFVSPSSSVILKIISCDVLFAFQSCRWTEPDQGQDLRRDLQEERDETPSPDPPVVREEVQCPEDEFDR